MAVEALSRPLTQAATRPSVNLGGLFLLAELDRANSDNLMNHPITFAGGLSSNLISTNVPSIFAGETARRLSVESSGLGSFIWSRAEGQTGATNEFSYVIVEKDNADVIAVSMWDGNDYAGGAVAIYDLATEAVVSGPGGIQRLGIGPNGGTVFRLKTGGLYATPNGSRLVYVYPNGTLGQVAGAGVILHHALFQVSP